MMADRVIVSADELKAHWFSDECSHFGEDYSTGHRFVVMENGTEYATPHAEISAALRGEHKDG
jgi:hypothetical protein